MSDKKTAVHELKEMVKDFVHDRDWEKYHSPKNLSMSLAIEVGELMEHFQWLSEEQSRRVKLDKVKMSHIQDEIADVGCYLLSLCNMLGVDFSTAMKVKMDKNKKKYPAGVVEKDIFAYTYLKRQKDK